MPFKNLFKASDKPSDGMTQPAREAIVDVLHYCMYADSHISSREDQFIEDVARSFSWDPKISYEYYEGKSTGAARAALSDAKTRDIFFQTIRDRLNETGRKLAIDLANQLFVADGVKDSSESASLIQVKRLLA